MPKSVGSPAEALSPELRAELEEMLGLDQSLLLEMKQVCADLGIKMRSFQREVNNFCMGEMWRDGRLVESEVVDFCGFAVDRDSLFSLVNAWLDPDNVALLVGLHRAAVTPLLSKKLEVKRQDIPQYMLDYAASDMAELRRRSVEIVRAAKDLQAAEKAAELQRLNNLDAFKEEDFTYSLLNALFWHHQGKGVGALTIGGVSVSKSLAPYKSNSGKSSDFAVTFHWQSGDGSRKWVAKESRFSDNRRNDAERNWGLPE